MNNNLITKSPCVVLKECLSKEFAEILEEPRVQQLMLLLDRINEYSSFVFNKTFEGLSTDEKGIDWKLDIQCRIQQISIDMSLFNRKLIELRDSLK